MRPMAASVFGVILSTAAFTRAEDPPSPQETYDLAQELASQHDTASAEKLYAQLLNQADAPSMIRSAAGLCDGDCLLALKRPASARAAFALVLKLFGDQPDVAKRAQASLDGIPADAKDSAVSVLDGTSIALSFNEEPTPVVTAWLAKELHAAVLPDAGAEVLAGLKTTVDFRKQPAAEALRQLAAATGTAFVERAGLIIWTTPARAAELEKRAAVADMKGADEASEAMLKQARDKNITGRFSDASCAGFVEHLVRTTGLDIDGEGLPDKAFSLELGALVPVLDVLDAVAFELGLTLTAKDGKIVLRGK